MFELDRGKYEKVMIRFNKSTILIHANTSFLKTLNDPEYFKM